MPEPNPFPLNINNKVDSFEKHQLMTNVPENYKYTAAEFNKILSALKYLSENLSGSPIWGAIVGNIEDQQDLIDYIANLSIITNQSDDVLNSSYDWVANYTYLIIYVKFIKDGVITTTYFNQEKTLTEAHATLDRYDLLAFNLDTELIDIVTGTAAAEPSFPALAENQRLITPIFVEANTTAPADVDDTPIYNENAQEVGGEFDTSTNTPANVTLDDTDESSSGSTSIKFDTAALNDRVDFDVATPLAGADYSNLRFDVFLENAVNHNIRFEFRTQSPESGSNTINVYNNRYGLDTSKLNEWQTIVIPISAFNISTYSFDRIRMENKTAGASFRIDRMSLVSGLEDANNQENDFLLKGGYEGTAQDLKDLIDAIVSAGGGDMLASTYDPNNVEGDAFDMDNMVEGADTKILTAAERTAIASHTSEIAALVSSYSRRKAVIDIVDNTAAPPTEVSGDRYILDNTGASHANWDGASAFDIVEFDGTNWVATTPLEGYIAYVDAEDKDALYIDDGSPEWQLRDISAFDLAAAINGATNKATPVDADKIGIWDSVSGLLRNITWANIKTTLKTYFDTLYFFQSNVIDEDDMSSDSATKVPTQQSVKAYVDNKTESISVFGSDLDTALEVGEKELLFCLFDFTLVTYWIGALTEVPTGAALTVDLKKNGVSITSTPASIDAGEATSLTGTAPVLTTTSFSKGDIISRNITNIGATDAGKGLQIVLEIIKT